MQKDSIPTSQWNVLKAIYKMGPISSVGSMWGGTEKGKTLWWRKVMWENGEAPE